MTVARGPAHHHGGGGAPLQRVRQLVLYMVLALGACTLVTAGVLLMHTLDAPDSHGLPMHLPVVWAGGGGHAADGGKDAAGAGAGAAAGKAAVAAAAAPGGAHAAAKPRPKELDHDYVEPKAKAVVAYARKCPAGCEKRGNCNAEEGR